MVSGFVVDCVLVVDLLAILWGVMLLFGRFVFLFRRNIGHVGYNLLAAWLHLFVFVF